MSFLFFAGKEPITTLSLSGSKTIQLTATLTGGKGNVAWQHAQLFSEPVGGNDDFSFDVTVTLRSP